MTMDTDVYGAVAGVMENHLPALQMEWLRDRLEKTDDFESEVKNLEKTVKRLNKQLESNVEEIARLQSSVDTDDALAKRGEDMVQRERDNVFEYNRLLQEEALLKLREEHAQASIDMMRGVVTDVFSNNRFKYQRTDQITVDEGSTTQYDNNGGLITVPNGETLQTKVEHVTGEG